MSVLVFANIEPFCFTVPACVCLLQLKKEVGRARQYCSYTDNIAFFNSFGNLWEVNSLLAYFARPYRLNTLFARSMDYTNKYLNTQQHTT